MKRETLDHLSKMLFERFFHSGQVIYNKTEASMTFYIIKSGKVKLRCPLMLDKYNQWPSVNSYFINLVKNFKLIYHF